MPSKKEIQRFIDQATGDDLIAALLEALGGPAVDAASIGAQVGADDLLRQVGVDLDMIDPKIADRLEKRIEKMIERVAEETAKATRELLNTMNQQSESDEEFRSALVDYLEGTEDVEGLDASARRIARTETAKAYNEGTLSILEASGVTHKRWMTNAGACEFCRAVKANNPIVPIDRLFYRKGHVLKGVKGGTMRLDYAGVDAPPLHPNCRCYVAPVR